jgi:hypothetical protein
MSKTAASVPGEAFATRRKHWVKVPQSQEKAEESISELMEQRVIVREGMVLNKMQFPRIGIEDYTKRRGVERAKKAFKKGWVIWVRVSTSSNLITDVGIDDVGVL